MTDTVDTIKAGDDEQVVQGIAVTFMATYDIVQRAKEIGANLIITHEPTYYNHEDKVGWLAEDAVFAAKKRLVDESGVTIFRFHDYCHRRVPDFILLGMLEALGWQEYSSKEQPKSPLFVTIPGMTLRDIANHVKESLGAPFVRVVGKDELVCRRIGLLSGYGGVGARAIPFFHNDDLDLVIAGEGPEWETPEYVRDAVAAGFAKGLIVVGHQKSEEAGMQSVANYLRDRFKDIPVSFLGGHQALRVM
ncbi:Nif3-like dinuclear metal center hexameric protein [Alicyclobacillus mengziensis]|uniref:GTP cyclohydrolase 1 type 2 homolog n=1 Tax=Alicyclobacillus mengziensis TaxID=2931921 RepID=A0A9X7Z9M4_9BACL|nr:Nif3-like dinuclear metal center hexameric protein [Alicyclobacillus mengziensis]